MSSRIVFASWIEKDCDGSWGGEKGRCICKLSWCQGLEYNDTGNKFIKGGIDLSIGLDCPQSLLGL